MSEGGKWKIFSFFGLASEWFNNRYNFTKYIMRMLLLVVLILIMQSHARKFEIKNIRNSIKTVHSKT